MKREGGGGVIGHFGGGLALRDHRAVDGFKYRADCPDRLRNALHGVGRADGIALQRLDLSGDFDAAFCVCTASAFTSVATTAKPRPAWPARAASMVELSASSVALDARSGQSG